MCHNANKTRNKNGTSYEVYLSFTWNIWKLVCVLGATMLSSVIRVIRVHQAIVFFTLNCKRESEMQQKRVKEESMQCSYFFRMDCLFYLRTLKMFRIFLCCSNAKASGWHDFRHGDMHLNIHKNCPWQSWNLQNYYYVIRKPIKCIDLIHLNNSPKYYSISLFAGEFNSFFLTLNSSRMKFDYFKTSEWTWRKRIPKKNLKNWSGTKGQFRALRVSLK